MSKMSELSQVLDELVACGEGLIHAATAIRDILTSESDEQSKVGYIPAECLFYKVGTKAVGISSLLCILAGLVSGLCAQLGAWRADKPSVAFGNGGAADAGCDARTGGARCPRRGDH